MTYNLFDGTLNLTQLQLLVNYYMTQLMWLLFHMQISHIKHVSCSLYILTGSCYSAVLHMFMEVGTMAVVDTRTFPNNFPPRISISCVCIFQRAVPVSDLLSCLLFISQQVFPVLHKWRYHEPRARDRIGLYIVCCYMLQVC